MSSLENVDLTRVSLFVWNAYKDIKPPEHGNYLCWVHVFDESLPNGMMEVCDVIGYEYGSFVIHTKLKNEVIYWAEVPHPEQG